MGEKWRENYREHEKLAGFLWDFSLFLFFALTLQRGTNEGWRSICLRPMILWSVHMFHPLSPLLQTRCASVRSYQLYIFITPSIPLPSLTLRLLLFLGLPSLGRATDDHTAVFQALALSHSAGLCAVIQPFSGNAIPPCDIAIACIYCHLALMINNGRNDLMIVHPDIIFWSLSDSFNLPHPELDHSAASGTGALTEQCAPTWTTWIRIKWAAGLCYVPQRVSEGLRFFFLFFFYVCVFFSVLRSQWTRVWQAARYNTGPDWQLVCGREIGHARCTVPRYNQRCWTIPESYPASGRGGHRIIRSQLRGQRLSAQFGGSKSSRTCCLIGVLLHKQDLFELVSCTAGLRR